MRMASHAGTASTLCLLVLQPPAKCFFNENAGRCIPLRRVRLQVLEAQQQADWLCTDAHSYTP